MELRNITPRSLSVIVDNPACGVLRISRKKIHRHPKFPAVQLTFCLHEHPLPSLYVSFVSLSLSSCISDWVKLVFPSVWSVSHSACVACIHLFVLLTLFSLQLSPYLLPVVLPLPLFAAVLALTSDSAASVSHGWLRPHRCVRYRPFLSRFLRHGPLVLTLFYPWVPPPFTSESSAVILPLLLPFSHFFCLLVL